MTRGERNWVAGSEGFAKGPAKWSHRSSVVPGHRKASDPATHPSCFKLYWLFALALIALGCGRNPLVKLRTHPGCPWSGPGQQVQEGERSMGRSFYGNIWKKFWRDPSGREYDPERVANDVWQFLGSTGNLTAIDAARNAGQCTDWMRIVSVNPTVVLKIPCQHKRFADSKELQFHGTKLALELSFVPDTEMYFDEPMQWLSPDLKQGPTQITFTEGVAEIPLKSGKLVLTQDGERCQVRRE